MDKKNNLEQSADFSEKDLKKEINKKLRKAPIPQSADRIKEGALKLSLEQKVDLRNTLTAAIDLELKEMEANFNKAKALLNSKQ